MDTGPLTPFSAEENLFDSIIDELAQDGYAIADGFLSNAEVIDARERLLELRKQDEFHTAGIGRTEEMMVDRSIRGDKIRWIDPEEPAKPTEIYLGRMDALQSYINRTLYLGLKQFECHFTCYPPGTFYLRHLDQFQTDNHRRISAICYLNTDWKPGDGGELVLYVPQADGTEKEVKIEPLTGRMACFLSDRFEHEVLETKINRYSLTGWFLDCEPGLKFLD